MPNNRREIFRPTNIAGGQRTIFPITTAEPTSVELEDS
jgi:hypothetical protein